MENISKSFPGVKALSEVNLTVRRGTVHALMGENGAGKSTLMKVLIGMYIRDSGTITFQGKPVDDQEHRGGAQAGHLHDPPGALACPLYDRGRKHLAGARAARPLRHDRQAQDGRRLPATCSTGLRSTSIPTAVMKELSVANTQMVEIAKAISYDSSLIIMDEPTSAITEREVAHLFRMIRSLQDKGVAIIYITHKMDEVFQIADDITVFRDGRHIATVPAAQTDKNQPDRHDGGPRAHQYLPQGRRADRRGRPLRAQPDPQGDRRGCHLRPAPRRNSRHGRPDGRRPHRGHRGHLRDQEDRRRRDRDQRQKGADQLARGRHPARAGAADRGSQAHRHHGRAARARQHDDRQPAQLLSRLAFSTRA